MGDVAGGVAGAASWPRHGESRRGAQAHPRAGWSHPGSRPARLPAPPGRGGGHLPVRGHIMTARTIRARRPPADTPQAPPRPTYGLQAPALQRRRRREASAGLPQAYAHVERPADGGLCGLPARDLLAVLAAVQQGDFSARLVVDEGGAVGRVADLLNAIVAQNEGLAAELERVRDEVGKKGRLAERAALPGTAGAWRSAVGCVNELIIDLGQPVAEVERVIGAVATGDLSQKVDLEAEGRPIRGEFLRTAKMVNTMVDQLQGFASEVTRVAREVGTEGELGGQAEVEGVSGTWKDLTDNVNAMAGNLTVQLRDVSKVATAIANGDLTQKITVDVRGEILQIKDVINRMVDQLSSFASEVTRVAREVGTEGELGGQAEVEGVSGTWKDLTDNVNYMAGDLTTQVRAIAEVTTAVANGDLSKKSRSRCRARSPS